MTYAPLWPGWADDTRDTIAASLAELPDDVADIVRRIGETIGDDLRGEFCDVEPGIVGWVAMRVGSHLGRISDRADPSILALVGMLAGQHVQAGAA